jgi:hypothetical protein
MGSLEKEKSEMTAQEIVFEGERYWIYPDGKVFMLDRFGALRVSPSKENKVLAYAAGRNSNA